MDLKNCQNFETTVDRNFIDYKVLQKCQTCA